MMNLLKWTTLLVFIAFSNLANSKVQYDHVLNTNSAIVLSEESIDVKFDNALFLEEEILRNFSPNGVKVLSKKVEGRHFEINIEKKIFGFTKRFAIIGNLQVEKTFGKCQADENSFLVFFDFSQSGPEVTDAVSAFGLNICTKNKNSIDLSISTINSLFYRGKKYGFITEPIAKSVLNDQVEAFFKSVKLTMNAL